MLDCLVPGQKILLPRKFLTTKFCWLELSQQQATCCQELSSQHISLTCCLENAQS